MTTKHSLRALMLLTLLPMTAAFSADVVRYPLLGGDNFPIARAVAVPAGETLIFQSGTGPSPHDANAASGSREYWGDTKTQTVSVFNNIKASLAPMGLSFKDVVKMNVFLVADPAMGHMDFDGFMQGYTQFFGTAAQPNLPARTTVQVAGLADPGALVEIEVVLATSKRATK